MPDIMVGTVRKARHVDDESKNKRSVLTLRYPVEHSTTTDWDDATKESIAWLSSSTVWKTCVASRTVAIVNQNGLRLTPWNQDSFQSCIKCHQDNTFTSVVPASREHQLAVQALTDEIHQRRDAALHTHRHQKSSLEREEDESPRRANPDKSATGQLQKHSSNNSSAASRAS